MIDDNIIFLEKCKDLWKSGKIRIPNKYRKEWGFLPSVLVDVYVENGNIIIEHMNYDSTHNKRYINIEGEIRIPIEFYKVGNIEENKPYCIYADKMRQRLILSNEITHTISHKK